MSAGGVLVQRVRVRACVCGDINLAGARDEKPDHDALGGSYFLPRGKIPTSGKMSGTGAGKGIAMLRRRAFAEV